MCYYYDEDLKFFKDGDEIMKEVIVSAGLVYIYLNGYLENERLHIQSIDTYSCLENGFYQRVIEASTIANEVDEIVHIFAVVGVKEKANQIYSMIEKRLKNNFNNIIAGKNIKKSSKMLDKTGNVFFRCVQEFFCEQLDHFPKQVNYDFNDFTIKGICSSRLPDYVGDSITNEIIYIWLEREKPMLCGRQLMIRSFFVRDFIGRKVIASLPNKENESWRFIFEGGHQISMNEKFSYLKETLHPDDLGGFCSSNIQSILMNPIYAYGQWFQPNDVCEEWHKVFLYLCAISDNEWNIALLRYFNPIGAHKSGLLGESPNDIPNNLMPYIVKVANKELPYLHVYGNDYDTPDGTGVRDYIHVVDLAKGHVNAVNKVMEPIGVDAYNLGTGIGYSVLDVVNTFAKVNNIEVPYQIDPRRPGDIAQCYASTEKALKELGWKAERGLEEMCADAWHFLQVEKEAN